MTITDGTAETAGERRAFTDAEISSILHRIDAADSTAGLLTDTIRAVYDTLLSGSGLSMDTLPGGGKLDPALFAIPTAQWQAIVTAVTSRAAAWGTAPELALELINRLPASYDDPTVVAPAAVGALPDRRPTMLELHLTRDACDVIAAATHHIDVLTRFYGWHSHQATRAASSWTAALSRLLSLSFGATTNVRRDGDLSLHISTGSGYVYGIIFHADTRRCLAGDGCTAIIADDGTTRPQSSASVVAAHEHQPSFPLDGPHPGSWSLHS
jgi:hypothetical protein